MNFVIQDWAFDIRPDGRDQAMGQPPALGHFQHRPSSLHRSIIVQPARAIGGCSRAQKLHQDQLHYHWGAVNLPRRWLSCSLSMQASGLSHLHFSFLTVAHALIAIPPRSIWSEAQGPHDGRIVDAKQVTPYPGHSSTAPMAPSVLPKTLAPTPTAVAKPMTSGARVDRVITLADHPGCPARCHLIVAAVGKWKSPASYVS